MFLELEGGVKLLMCKSFTAADNDIGLELLAPDQLGMLKLFS